VKNDNKREKSYRKLIESITLPGYLSDSDLHIVKQSSQELSIKQISPLQKFKNPKFSVRISEPTARFNENNNLPGYLTNSDFHNVKQNSQEISFEQISPLRECENLISSVRILEPTARINENNLPGYLSDSDLNNVKQSSQKIGYEKIIPSQKKDVQGTQDPLYDKKTNSQIIHNHTLAELLIDTHKFAVIEGNLYYWNQTLGYFVGLTGENADIFIRQNIPDKYKSRISFNSCQEILRWIMAKDEMKVNEELLVPRKSFVAFSNCIINIKDFSAHSHDPDYFFTSVLNAEYPLRSIPKGPVFESFISQITGGDQRLYMRLQELFGYVISEIRDVKVIPYLVGVKDSGKSIILRLLEHLVGPNFFTNLSFSELNQQSFLCQLFEKKLNTCGETSEIALNRLDNFKKLSGGDYVMARYLYGQAFKFINKAALIFAGNHLPTIKGIDKSNAFSERLVIFPFNHQVPKEEQDIHLFDKLMKETSYIAHWALIGLQRWIDNNYQFTTCEQIEKMAREYSEQTNSIDSFIKSCCYMNPDSKTHNDVLETAYKKYCRSYGMIEESSRMFHKNMKTITNLTYSRFRLKNENKYGYIGIGLKDTTYEV